MACELAAALWQRQKGREFEGAGDTQTRRDKLKEPLEKRPGPTATTTPQQGHQSSSGIKLGGKKESVLKLSANTPRGILCYEEGRKTLAEKKFEGPKLMIKVG